MKYKIVMIFCGLLNVIPTNYLDVSELVAYNVCILAIANYIHVDRQPRENKQAERQYNLQNS